MSDQLPESPKPLRIAGIEIPNADQSPLVLALLAVIQRLEAENKELRDEIQRLKKTTARPKIAPSRLLKPTPPPSPDPKPKRPGSAKHSKTKDLNIHEVKILLSDGSLLVAGRTADFDSHFGVALRQYILLQVH